MRISPTQQEAVKSRVRERAPGFEPFPRQAADGSIPDRFRYVATRYGDRVALRTPGQAMTYRELDHRSDMLAWQILEAQPAAAPVALLMQDTIDFVAALYAILKAGRPCVPLDPRFPDARLGFMYADSQATVLLADRAQAERAGGLAGCSGKVVVAEPVPDGLRKPLAIDVSPRQTAYLVYTSGSTGRPKGVMQTHRLVLHDLMNQNNALFISAEDRFALFATGTSLDLTTIGMALLNGAALYPFRFRDEGPLRLRDWVQREAITVLRSTPMLFREFTAHLADADEFPHLRVIRLGGEPARMEDVAAYRRHFPAHCVLVNGLSSSETKLTCVCYIDHDTGFSGDRVPVGYPVTDKRIHIVDQDDRLLGREEAGELVIESDYLAAGYWRLPDLTAAAFRPLPGLPGAGCYHTGDRAVLRADGLLEHLGRKDFVVKVKGYLVDLGEVEHAVGAVPGVREAAVKAFTGEDGGTWLAAYVVPEPSAAIGESSLRQTLGEQLPHYMIPAVVAVVDALPRTPAGKLDRHALAQPARRSISATPRREPGDELERRCLEVWREVFGSDGVGPDDDFFALGGDSLRAVRLAARLEAVLGRTVPVSALLQAPTAARLVAEIRRTGGPVYSFLLAPCDRRAARPPLFCVYGLFLYRPLAEALAPDHPTYGIYVEAEVDLLTSGGRSTASWPTVELLAGRYIDEMRAVQATGPYQLAGESFGGVVAYEMARQLAAQGEEVRLLALLDSHLPGSRRPHSLRGWMHHARSRLSAGMKNLLDRRGAMADLTEDQLDRLRGMVRKNASRCYRPAFYTGSAVLLKAQTPVAWPGYRVDDDYGWASYLGGRLDLHEIPGDHLGILRPPNVRTLAETLRRYLA